MKNNGDISFLGKIILWFKNIKLKFKEMRLINKITSRQKEIACFEGEGSSAEAKLSYGLGITKVVSLAVLCVFLCVSLIFGGSIISYENVYYMFKEIGYISSFSESRPDSLSYSAPFVNQDFTTFKNGLAVSGDSEIKLFTSTGRVTLTVGCDYTNPKICSSDSTVLIYDQGRRSFSVYNSFISVYSETLDYPISSAHMATDGSFCVVTKSKEHNSTVRVYDKKFNLEMEYSKNDYVISAKLSADRKRIAVVSLDASGGESVVTLTVIERSKNSVRSSVKLSGFMPYFAEFISDDRIALVCSDSAHVYDLDCKRKNMFEFPYNLEAVSVGDKGLALLMSRDQVGTVNMLAVLDRNGNLRNTELLSGRVVDMKMHGDDVTIMFRHRICRFDSVLGSKKEVSFSEEDARLLVLDNGDIMVCTPTVAYFVYINK